MTLVLRRLLASSTYAISDTLGKLAGRLETQLNQAEPAPGFDEVLADEFAAYEEIREELTDDLPTSHELVAKPVETRREDISAEVTLLREFQKLADSIKINSKGEVLMRALREPATTICTKSGYGSQKLASSSRL